MENGKRTDPAIWLRLRPELTDTPAEFLRDWYTWAQSMMRQDGFTWGEFEWFHGRAQTLYCRLDDATDQAKRLHTALERYGQHDPDCYMVQGDSVAGMCSCGLLVVLGDRAGVKPRDDD